MNNMQDGKLTKLINFTMHQQSIYLDTWVKQGFNVEPTPQAPRVYKGLTEIQVYDMVYNKLSSLYVASDYGGVLLGGLTNLMCYAWYACNHLKCATYIIKSPRTSAELIRMVSITDIQGNL